MLIDRTKAYVEAFNNCDIDALGNFFHQEVGLFDPANDSGIFGKENVLSMIRDLFNKQIVFVANNIFLDGNHTIIEFSLSIDNQSMKGVDIIEWHNEKIKALRAYLY